MNTFLHFPAEANHGAQVGRVHTDGSVTFRGRRYSTIRDVPPGCRGLRPDVETHCRWRALYGPIDPVRKRRRRERGAINPP